MKHKIKMSCCLLLFSLAAFAQKADGIGHVTLLKKNETANRTEGIGHVTLLRKNPQFNLSFGTTTPGNTTETDANFNAGMNVNLTVFVPLIISKKGWDGISKSSRTFGFNVGGEYFKGDKDYADGLTRSYNVFGQTAPPIISAKGTGSPKQQGFRGEAGAQLNFNFGKLTVSPIVNVGYMSTIQKAFEVTQTTTLPDPQGVQQYLLLSQDEARTNGLALIPKLRLTYFFGRLGVFVEGSYVTGPTIRTQTATFKPLGEPNIDNGTYESQQMDLGTYAVKNTETKYTAVNLNAGITVCVGKRSDGIGHVTLLKKNETAMVTKVPQQDPKPVKKLHQNCVEYNAPELISPNNSENVIIQNGELQLDYKRSNALFVNYKVMLWREIKGRKELVQEKIYPDNFNGTLSGLKLSKDKIENLSIQMQAIPCTEGNCPDVKGDKAVYQKAGCTTFTNGGFSKIISFAATQDDCTPNYNDVALEKAECIDGGKLKIYGHYRINTSATQNLVALTLDALEIKANNQPVQGTNFSTGLANMPLNVAPNQLYNFTFEIDGEAYCEKELAIKLHFSHSLNCGTAANPDINTNTHYCQKTLANLPCCVCNYCKPENMLIVNDASSATPVNGNNLNIRQQITITPKAISRITAAVVSIKEYEVDEACKTCRKSQEGELLENDVYHFIGTNTLNWTSNNVAVPATSSNAGHSFPSKIIEWKTNKKGTVNFDLTIALPGNSSLSCCERHGEICVRYSFTDNECKTCSLLVCYTY